MEFSKYLSAKSIVTFSGLNYFQAGLSFLTSLLLARELGQEAYGVFTYGLIFSNTFSILVQFGMDKTLVRDLVQRSDAATFLIAASLLKLFLSIGGMLLLVGWMFFFSEYETGRFYVVLFCSFAGCLLGVSPKAWFDYTGKIQQNALIMLLDRLIFFGGSLWLIYAWQTADIIVHIAFCLLLGRLVMSILEWQYVRDSVPGKQIGEWKPVFVEVFKNNQWVWLAALGNLLMTNVNQLLVDSQLGTAQLGLYGFALQLIMLVKLLQNQILRLSAPSIAEVVGTGDSKLVLKAFKKGCVLSLSLTFLLLAPVYFTAPTIIHFLVGETFLAAVPIFNMLCVWIMIYGIALIVNQYLLSYHLQRAYFSTTVFFGIISIFLAYVFIDWYGAVGAALSLFVAHLGSIIVQCYLVIREIYKHDQAS